MKPKFNTFDHFKGSYKSAPKENKDFFGIDPIDYEDWSLPPPRDNIDDCMTDALIYGTGCFDIQRAVKKGFSKIMADTLADLYGGERTLPIIGGCNHEPIDVGFAVPKMVCKKCNKDL